jgi:hypothetical protein
MNMCASDVAKALGYADPDKATRTHCKSSKKLNSAELAELGFSNPPPSGLIHRPPDAGAVLRGAPFAPMRCSSRHSAENPTFRGALPRNPSGLSGHGAQARTVR